METLDEKKHEVRDFDLSSIEAFKKLTASLGLEIETSEDTSILTQPVDLGPIIAPNSMATQAMEGCDGDNLGRPTALTYRRYERFAAGGAGVIWGEAIAVVPEGRANPRQLWLNEKSKDAMAELITRMRQAARERFGADHHPVIVAQLTHSGRYSKPEGIAEPMIPQHDPYRDIMIPQFPPDMNAKKNLPADWPIITDEYLDELQEAYLTAAKIAFDAGFDGVDIKSCHGYLINEILACFGREGKYGGSFENRTRILLEIVDKIHERLGEDKLVTTRFPMYDAIPYPYGWGVSKDDFRVPDLTEPKKLLKLLQQRGVKIINSTIGNPYYNPHIGRPFNEAIIGAYDEPEHPLVGVNRMLKITGEIQKSVPDMAVIGAGYSWLRSMMPYVGAANKKNGLVTLISGGRMAFAYPDFPADIIATGKMYPEKCCIGCSACTQIMRDGGRTGCVVRDNEVYGPIFRYGRMKDRQNLIRLAESCRGCGDPTCKLGCPAGVDIPKFIAMFLEGDDRSAYEVIRQANLLPEICAWLCPVEQQCQGHCIQKFIGDGPLQIADIQKYLSVQANKNGWSKLRIPDKCTNKKVAVIGAGPAGLSCAAVLLERGHIVTVFDKNEEFGGMVGSVIPGDRQSDSLKNEVAAIFSDVPKDRLILKMGTKLDDKFNLDKIKKDFDAVFIGLGLPESIVSSEIDLEGLYNALDFLNIAKQEGKLNLKGKRAAVIGGGNTAMDAALTAKKLGAKDVYIIYRRSFEQMPAWPAERDVALNSGVHFLLLTQQLGYESSNGKLTAVKLCPTALGDPDASGRRKPVAMKDSAYSLPMDVVVESIGQSSSAEIEKILPGIKMEKGLIKTEKNSFQTSIANVFAGGDLLHGASTVVAAVADGMAAGKQIDKFLKQ